MLGPAERRAPVDGVFRVQGGPGFYQGIADLVAQPGARGVKPIADERGVGSHEAFELGDVANVATAEQNSSLSIFGPSMTNRSSRNGDIYRALQVKFPASFVLPTPLYSATCG